MSDLSGLAEALIGGEPERLFRLGEVEAVNPGPPRTLTVDGRAMRYLFRASVTDIVLYVDEGNDPFAIGKLSNGDDGVPLGVPLPFLGPATAVPAGYLLCDGRSTSGYPDLAALIGANTPDLRNRTLVGAGSSYALGATGGAASVALSTAQLPSHSHGMGAHGHSFSGSVGGGGVHRHGINLDYAFTFSHDHGNRSGQAAEGIMTNRGGTFRSDTAIWDVPGHGHSLSGSVGSTDLPDTGAIGSGSAHENMPPFRAVNYIVRAA